MNPFRLLFASLTARPFIVSALPAVVAAALLLSCPPTVHGQQMEWIWSADHEKEKVPQGACYFRRSFELSAVKSGTIAIAADDRYELFVNGRRIGSGGSWATFDSHDIAHHLVRGTNVIAVKVNNTEGTTAALAAKVTVKLRDDKSVTVVTDATWITHRRPLPFWYSNHYGDGAWKGAQSFGPQGRTEPWLTKVHKDDKGELAAQAHGDFRLAEGFALELVAHRRESGSLIAMTFNEFGQIICSREDGPLLLISDSNDDTVPDKTRVYCDKVKNCQGILCVSGKVFVVGDGPQGAALYRLSDDNHDGTAETVKTILRFDGGMGEYGPHGLVLGPDGLIYVSLGNAATPVADYASDSPHRDYYEGDLPTSRQHDPGKQALGVKAPGGVVIRTNTRGSFVELLAGGLRNAYDLAFNSAGDLFTHDSDMEGDRGLPCYRPTRVNHVIPGAEFGWRSGWAKWPDYYVDSLPAVLDTGLGSPTGMVFYDHVMYPKRYQNVLFTCDWAQGRVLVVRMKPSGGGYTAKSEVFLAGEPMNVTDIEVGPDGWLYFVTGGRGTPGGVYRVVWEGKVPEAYVKRGEGIAAAIRQPQLHSAWGRQRIATRKVELKDRWGSQLRGVARAKTNPVRYRTRALDLMQLFGPHPSPELLVILSRDEDAQLRAKTAWLMGIHANEATHKRLVELLQDGDAAVRRKACEALVRSGKDVEPPKLTKMLSANDRFEAWAARELLQRTPADKWQDTILKTGDHRLFIQGATALMAAKHDKATAKLVTARVGELSSGYVSDRDFVDMLRVLQLAVLRGGLTADDIPEMRDLLVAEFPSANATMNRELTRLLVHLKASSIADRYIAHLESDIPDVEKLPLALHLGLLHTGWTSEQRFKLLGFYEDALAFPGGRSLPGYVEGVSRQFVATLDDEEKQRVLVDGAKLPGAAFAVLSQLPERLDAQTRKQIRQLDQDVKDLEGEFARRVRIAIVAVLARSGDPDCVAYLREIFDRDPDRRMLVAMGLAQQEGDENWEYLVRSLPVLSGPAAVDVLRKLRSIDRVPEKAEDYRHLIVLGLSLGGNGSQDAVALLEKWTGKRLSGDGDPWDKSLAAWQQWFAAAYPDQPEARLPIAARTNRPAAEVSRRPDDGKRH